MAKLMKAAAVRQYGKPLIIGEAANARPWLALKMPGSGIHGAQALAVAQHDLAGAGKSQHAFAVQLRERP
jgi:hypothetical protein